MRTRWAHRWGRGILPRSPSLSFLSVRLKCSGIRIRDIADPLIFLFRCFVYVVCFCLFIFVVCYFDFYFLFFVLFCFYVVFCFLFFFLFLFVLFVCAIPPRE
ncbi:hypothetical protein [Blackfly microvirus SF02]|uniref:Uncharacterized protein n=1 Tax=Blackfly microvirus SF02 TaxID=2576452 RepID=A0A4P8PP91_9VIRU|nr:hypothetical protein [Blackfly microvirus SF02]